ncbi:MAG: TetR/AcrR family transcriptional regulator [Janthinobacterium lividum]
MRKGELTRVAILDMALDLASRNGLEGLTIGSLAERMQMSKSGVFAHFGSREELQIAVLKLYHHRFEQEIFQPAIGLPRGLPRLRALFAGWVSRVALELVSGCIYISGAVEYDDRPGAIRDALLGMVRAWQQALLRSVGQAVELGHLRVDTDAAQLVFEMHGLILALHHEARFMQQPDSIRRAQLGFDRLIDSYCSATQNASTAVAAALQPAHPINRTTAADQTA